MVAMMAGKNRHQGSGIGHQGGGGGDPMMVGARGGDDGGGLFGVAERLERGPKAAEPSPSPLPEGEGLRPCAEWADGAATTHEAKAREWMRANPEAMDLFLAEARKSMRAVVAMGRSRIGIKAIAERVRYEFEIERMDADFRINNSFVAYIARELIRRDPSLAAFIETRRAGGEEEHEPRARATGHEGGAA